MPDKHRNHLRDLLVVAALFVFPGLSNAQVDTSEWACESCPFESGYRADYELGAIYVDDDSARFGNATGLDEEGTYADVNGEGRYVNDGYRLDWYLEDLGLDSRVAEIEGGRQGSYDFHLGYREIPYRRFDTTQTVFNPSSSDTLSLPTTWVPASTTGGMTDLYSSLRVQDIGSDRKVLDAGAGWDVTRKLRIFADLSQQTREGIDVMAGPSYTQSSLLPRWFDFETNQVDIGLQYGTERASLQFAYYGSFFKDNNESLTWDTPFTTTPGAQQLRQAQEPDNSFQQFVFSGAYRATTWNTVLAFSLAAGSGEQNDTLLPYTINPDINASALPVTSLDAKVDTGNYALTVTSRPTDRIRLKFAYTYDERDNNTEQYVWDRVITDLLNSNDPEQNTPYSFKRSRLKLSGEWRFHKKWRVSAGYDRTELDRDYQEVAEQTEDSGWGQLRWQPSAWFDLRARGGASTRDIDRYNTMLAESFGQNPLMRKYNLAYRYRTYGELTASAASPDVPVSFSATVFYAEDSYTESQLGMTESEEVRYSVDINWSITDTASTYLLIGNDQIDSAQLGSEQFDDADWQALHNDNFDHIGFGFLWRQTEGNFDLKFDYTRGDGTTEILMSSESGGQSPLPDLTSKLDSLRLEALYRWSDRWETTIDLRNEQFSTEDWSLQNVEPDTLPTILTLGADPYDYDVWAVGIGLRYRFGAGDIALVD
jgi:MtrB/PioB family decaheme-associated outer membrane protein